MQTPLSPILPQLFGSRPKRTPWPVRTGRVYDEKEMSGCAIAGFIFRDGTRVSGERIIDGIARRDDGMLYGGVLLVAGMAIGTDVLLSWLQRRLTQRGVRMAAELESERASAGAS